MSYRNYLLIYLFFFFFTFSINKGKKKKKALFSLILSHLLFLLLLLLLLFLSLSWKLKVWMVNDATTAQSGHHCFTNNISRLLHLNYSPFFSLLLLPLSLSFFPSIFFLGFWEFSLLILALPIRELDNLTWYAFISLSLSIFFYIFYVVVFYMLRDEATKLNWSSRISRVYWVLVGFWRGWILGGFFFLFSHLSFVWERERKRGLL